MNKKNFTLLNKMTVAISLSFLALSGCQTLSNYNSGYKKIENAENATMWAGEVIPIDDEVNIVCAGTYHCEIIKIDKSLIISAETHLPVDSKMLVPMSAADGTPYIKLNKRQKAEVQANTIALANNKSVKIVPLSASGMPGLVNYYARVKPIKREIHVNFYPENNLGYIERFALIDEFKDPGVYLLQAYRKKPTKDNGSLLDNASSAPLCIDLLKDKALKRRFCKQLNSANQGEFEEIVLANKTK